MKFNYTAYLYFLFFSFCYSDSFSQNAVWAKEIASSAPGISRVRNMVVDDLGNSYLICYANKMGIAKYNKNGQLIWLKQIETLVDIERYTSVSIDIDIFGNVIIAGTFEKDADFDPGIGVANITTAGYTDFFVEKLDSSGAFQWVKKFGNIRYDHCTAMKTDKDGNIIIVGRTEEGNIDFDPGPGVFNSNSTFGNMYICKLSNDGNLIQVKRFGEQMITSAIEIDAFENILLVGTAKDVIFAMKVDKNLELKWEKRINSTNPNSREENAVAVKTDLSGNVYFTGDFRGTIDADPGIDTFYLTATGSQDFYLIKLNSAGNFIFGKVVGGNRFTYVTSLAIDNSANLLLGGYFENTVDFDPGPGKATLYSKQGTLAYLLKLNSNGEYLWAEAFYGSTAHKGTLVALDPENRILIAGNFDRDISFPTTDGNRTGLFAEQNPDVYIAKLADVNNVFGNTFFDLDSNGVKNENEFFLPDIVLKASSVSDTFYTSSDFQGKYNLLVDTGSYSISVPTLPLYYTRAIPSTQTATFGKRIGVADSSKNFGLVPIRNKKDLQINITNLTAARPGFKAIYRITYKNIGTTTMSGSIVLKHADNLNFISSNPIVSNYSNPVSTWNFVNLLPMASAHIDITFTVFVNAIMNSSLINIVTINPVLGDERPLDNSDTLNHIVTSSYDPNDKSVFPEGNISPDFIATGKFLDYTIRFQNTGNDTAFNISIKDTISKNLEISTLELLSTSHACEMFLSKTGSLEWRFNNILLPDSNHNEPLSHGFIRYRIKPKNTLVLGDQIINKAHIYFDYNEDIITNEVQTILSLISDTLHIPIVTNIPKTICSDKSTKVGKLLNPPGSSATITIKQDGTDITYNKVDSSFIYNAGLPGNHNISVFYSKNLSVKKKDTSFTSVAMILPEITLSAPSTVIVDSEISILASLKNVNTPYTINWQKNGRLFTSTTNSSLTYTKEMGTDTLFATLLLPSNGCYTNYNVTSNIQIVASKDSFNTSIPLIFYPNPVKNQISILNIPVDKHYSVEIIDLYGRVLSKHLINTANPFIDVSNLKSSIYYITIVEKGNKSFIQLKKIIKL